MPLSILSASAGSGKTYRLSREFLCNCLLDKDPAYSSSVLAMTFTNKATSEMKSRILDLLLEISEGKLEIKDESDPLFQVNALIGKDEMKHRANAILRYLLKNYHQFSVSTIDSFFQKLIRQFQRELNLDHPFNIEMDTDLILNHAVEKLLENLSSGSLEFNWLLDWISEKLEEGKDWDIRRDLRELGKELFKEDITDSWGELNLDEMDGLFKVMKKFVDDEDKRFRHLQNALVQLLSSAGLNAIDFKYGATGFVSSWLKATDFTQLGEKKRFIEEAEFVDNWFSSATKDVFVPLISSVQDQIVDLRNEVMLMLEDNALKYLSYKAVMQRFRTYIALRFLYSSLQEYCREQDIMLLSESNKLVSRVVSESDASILFEKSGQRYFHIMVDEFQDTSRGQWHNLKPLFENSLSLNKKSLIVGDLKQAIYRWRNGDWQIMHSGVEIDLIGFQQVIRREVLGHNWRSAHSIVDFNNQVFASAAGHLTAFLEEKYSSENQLIGAMNTVYADLTQLTGKDHELQGSVELDILTPFEKVEPESTENGQEEEWQEDKYTRYKNWLFAKLNKLYAGGYKPSDIAILVRTGNEGARVIEWMHQWEWESGNKALFEAISENGFLLRNNDTILLLINALRYKLEAEKSALIPVMVKCWDRIFQNLPGQTHHLEDISAGTLPEFFQLLNGSNYSTLSEWFAYLIQSWNLADKSPAHLSRFMDIVREFELSHSNDPFAFSAWWTVKEDKLGIAADHNQNAVQVLTIHKSKGLQFPVVILPFTNVKLIEFKYQEIIYVHNNNDPILRSLGILPVNASSKKLSMTWFNQFCEDEAILKAIDSINMLYVALTRAEQRLLIASEELNIDKKTNQPKLTTLGDLLIQSLPESMQNLEEGGFYMGNTVYQPWKIKATEKIEELVIDTIRQRISKMKTGTWIEKSIPHRSDEIPASADTPSAKDYGSIMHALLEKLRDKDDLQRVVQELVEEGVMPPMLRPRIVEVAMIFLNVPGVASWFDPDLNIYVEKEIIEVDGKSYRPDRVILKTDKTILIDFKTGKPSDKYRLQLEHYRKLLERMGLPKIEAWIAYIDSSEIVLV